jgi:thermostable 8-oxoguanine DNA glycosylase
MTPSELEWFILFGIAVAGKNSRQTERKLNEFFHGEGCSYPFTVVHNMVRVKTLDKNLRRVKLGKYKLLAKGFAAAIKLDLANLTVETLSKVPGIGPKTARFILLYSGINTNVVPLDTHILRWLREQGYNAPKATPTGRRYLELEECFRHEARRRSMTIKELDTIIWQMYSKSTKEAAE